MKSAFIAKLFNRTSCESFNCHNTTCPNGFVVCIYVEIIVSLMGKTERCTILLNSIRSATKF